MSHTNLIGRKLTHYTLSGVLFETWQPTLTGVVCGVDPDCASVLLEVVEVHDQSVAFEVGSLLRVPTMGGSKERLSTVQPPPPAPRVEEKPAEEAPAEVH